MHLVFNFLGSIPRSTNARSQGKRVFGLGNQSINQSIKSCQTVFSSGGTILPCHQQKMNSHCSTFSPALTLSVFCILAISTGVQWHPVALIRISLMTLNVGNLFNLLVHYPYTQWWGSSCHIHTCTHSALGLLGNLHVLVGRMCMFPGKGSVKVIGHFQLGCFWIAEF